MMSNLTSLKLMGEANERYAIIRSCGYGKDFNVYKAHELNKPKVHYVIKSFKTREVFERESRMLRKLNGAKNITQMVDFYPSQMIIVCECALYDLETFLGHQDYNQRHEEKANILKDLVSGLSELHKHEIVHTELAPKNIMYFQEKDGYTESWKLIDFDAACFAGSDNVKIITNYSAPEVIRARENGEEIIAEFATDMFSFGLVLYFLETGHHYWDGENEEIKNDMISKKHLQLCGIRDPSAIFVIRQLLNKKITHRMTLRNFMQNSYYTDESSKQNNNNNNNGGEILEVSETMNEIELRLYKKFLENYHNEMKQNLKLMSERIDDCTTTTKKIPQWLVKLKNEKVPRMFVIIPDQKDWKKPASWFSNPFRLLFVCEHKEQLHVPEQEGYKVLEVPQFIKKYGPWINICLQMLACAIKVMTSNIFPQGVADILSSVFNINNNFSPDLMKYFQEIIDTVEIGVNILPDKNPDFIPLNREANSRYQIINDSGLHELKKFLDTQDSADHLGGLIQCVDDETQDFLWLCEKHRCGYSSAEKAKPIVDSSRLSIQNCSMSPSNPYTEYNPSNPFSIKIDSSRSLNTRNIPSDSFKLSPPPISPISPIESSKMNYSMFDIESLTDQLSPLDPYFALGYVCKLLGEVIENVMVSGRKHFRKDDIMEIAQKMRENMNSFKSVCFRWDDKAQKIQFMGILKNQVHLYIHFLMLIVRNRAVNGADPSFAKKVSFLYYDMIEINNIIKSGKSFSNNLSKLITALNTYNSHAIKDTLKGFAGESLIDVSNVALSRWYLAIGRIHIDNLSTAETQGGGILFKVTKQILDDHTVVAGKSLNYQNSENFLCVVKEIYLYNERQLNENDYIIKFHGYSVHNCNSTLFYDYADHGDLFEYFKVNHNSSKNLLKEWKNKIKLAWEISQGVKYLHDQKIVHLDLRSANILLKYNEKEKTLIPKISNFLWSIDFFSGKTSVYPMITISSEEEVWKRWYDSDRLYYVKRFESLPSSDIYSLGLLFWEIAWCKADNLPFKHVLIKKLYNHIQCHHEVLPEIPKEYQRWEHLINNMWQLKPESRHNIMTVESVMQKLFKGRADSISRIII